jgi:hypothetical protein
VCRYEGDMSKPAILEWVQSMILTTTPTPSPPAVSSTLTPDSVQNIILSFTRLHGMQQQGKFCDLSLKPIDGEPVSVHAVVMAAASEVIRNQLDNSFVVGPSGFVLPLELTSAELKAFVEFAYSGKAGCNGQIRYAVLDQLIGNVRTAVMFLSNFPKFLTNIRFISVRRT